jgi:hypothetical protein
MFYMRQGDKRVILFLHNQKIGRLFDPDEIYAGVEIEIPVYPPKTTANPP